MEGKVPCTTLRLWENIKRVKKYLGQPLVASWFQREQYKCFVGGISLYFLRQGQLIGTFEILSSGDTCRDANGKVVPCDLSTLDHWRSFSTSIEADLWCQQQLPSKTKDSLKSIPLRRTFRRTVNLQRIGATCFFKMDPVVVVTLNGMGTPGQQETRFQGVVQVSNFLLL